MNFFEVALFILGAAFFTISFFVGNEAENSTAKIAYEFGEDELKNAVIKIEKEIKNESDKVVNDAEDRLSKLSNETIMSVDDFSKQTLERIAHNHEEVVFMYHMLQTKEEDLKKYVSSLEQKEIETKQLVEKEIIPVKSGIELAQSKKNNSAQIPKMEQKSTSQIAKREPNKKITNTISTEAVIMDIDKDDNKNERILNLYKQKKTVLEISKELGLGQGEVKLVIDLYGKIS